MEMDVAAQIQGSEEYTLCKYGRQHKCHIPLQLTSHKVFKYGKLENRLRSAGEKQQERRMYIGFRLGVSSYICLMVDT